MASGNGEAEERQAMSEAARQLETQNVAGRMRESAQAMRQGAGTDQKSANGAEDIARALDAVAEQLGGATGSRDTETTRLSEQLSRTQELRDRVSRLQRSMEELAQGAQGAQGAQSAQSAQGAGEGLARLQRDIDQQMREAQKLAEGLQRENPNQKGGTTPEQWQRSVSAPGTEAFKQDFTKWEELKKNLLVALEQTESQLSDQLRARENRERLNAGRHDAVADTYRALVDRYYQSLAASRTQKPQPRAQPQR
jgi:hypothetical protein